MSTTDGATADRQRTGADSRTPGDRGRVLIIEDDPQIGRLMATELREAGHEVELVADGGEGLARFERGDVELVVLDLTLPGMDGLEICRSIRRGCRVTPIVMVSSRATMGDIVRGLELGADEYVTKPFATAELMARIQALFRRIDADRENGTSVESVVRRGPLLIDGRRHEARLDDVPVRLTAKEFDLLHLFARHPGRTFSRGELLNAVWGIEFEGYEHTVNTHINRLRKKIDVGPARAPLIETVWGVGYRFREREREG